MDLPYISGRLGSGVQILATHPGRINERLIEAFNMQLYGIPADAFDGDVKDLNVEARTFWRKVWNAVASAPKDEERGVFAPSIEVLSENEASSIAQLVVSVDAMVESALR